MAKGMLEAAGIECFLQGAHANALVPDGAAREIAGARGG